MSGIAMNKILLSITTMCVVVLLLIFLLKRLRQPYMVAYILAGVLIGPYVGRVFVNVADTASLGEIGILFLMFFLGMELNIPSHQTILLKPIISQGIKILLSIAFATLLGFVFDWKLYNIFLLAILFSFNSTAVISEYLQSNGDLRTPFGKMIFNILLIQDVLLAPVLTVFQCLSAEKLALGRLLGAILISISIFLFLGAIRHRQLPHPKLLYVLKDDHELQVFAGGVICLGFGLLAEMAGLSGAMGSFIAGMMVGKTPAFGWLEQVLKPFRVFFVSFFFMSIGLQLDLPFIAANLGLIMAGTFFILFSNSFLSTFVFRLLRYNWKRSLYGGALLCQTGEFGILAFSLAHSLQIIDNEFFKTGISVTALSLLFSTVWIGLLRKITNTVGESNGQKLFFMK